MTTVAMLLRMFFPPRCPFCREILKGYPVEDGAYPVWAKREVIPELLCRRCASELPWLKDCCPRCARELEGKGTCSCRKEKYAFENCCAVGRYTGDVREALHFFKYRQKKWLAEPLGKLLSWKLASLSWAGSIEAVVPVPLTPRRQAERGYNQAALLAGVVGKETGVPVLNILERVKETESQTGMKRDRRWENLKGAFRCQKGGQRYGHLLLIDDVLTTGATAHEAACALKDGVAERVSVAVFAR